MLHPDDEPGFGPALWDATPGVCCAAYQLGACSHTEDYDWDEAYAEELRDALDDGNPPPITYPF